MYICVCKNLHMITLVYTSAFTIHIISYHICYRDVYMSYVIHGLNCRFNILHKGNSAARDLAKNHGKKMGKGWEKPSDLVFS